MCKDSVAEPMLFNQPDPVGCLEPPAQTSDAIQHGVAGLPDEFTIGSSAQANAPFAVSASSY